jgi:outer membrane receptor protein involved in Fe transport
MKFSILFAAFLLLISNAFAQSTGKISGSITGSNKKAIEGATISLLRGKDSATLKLAVANKEGQFAFEKVVDGKYLVSVTVIDHQKKFSNIIEINPQQQAVQIPAISLVAVAKSLNDVAVTARRPMVEQRIDRTIVNVDASITNIGTSALEVLEKSPGVSVDRDGNISLKGKEGVLVMVDGRPTQVGGADLANMLRNMSSNQLDQIEIMTNPPARYDAAGTSGIINIKTKKTITAGYNGSATIGYSHGRYPKTNEGFNFNYREGKVNVFSNLSHNYLKQYGIIKINRNIFNGNTNTIDQIFDQEANRLSEGNSFTGKVGVDFFATKKTTFGAAININKRQMSANSPNITNISTASKTLESVTRAIVNNETDWKGFGSNLNFRTLLDKKGKEITSDIDFLKYGSQNDQFMVNSFTDAAGNPYRKADTLKGDLPQDIQVYTARVDYLHPLKKNARFEAGIKSGIVRTDNNAGYDSIQYGRIVHDFNRSNHFIYEENINAAYANLSTPLSKKITAQFGLRLENTNAKGRQITTGENFDRHYTQLFPTAYFQYKANDKNNFAANFGRRVRRPDYQSLNPFIKFIDRYTYSQGNPNLKPSVSNAFEISHTWKNQITTALNYSRVKDVVDGIIEQKGQETYTMPANISSLTQFGISINANTPVTKWWTSSININAFNNNYKGVVSSTPIDFAATSFVVTGTQQFKVNKTLTAELNGRFRNGWYEGVMRAKSIAFMGVGLSQQVLKNQGTLRFTVRDIFHSQVFRGRSQYGNVDFEIEQINETRVASLAFSYRFAKGKKIAPVKRTTGSSTEEQDRIGQ